MKSLKRPTSLAAKDFYSGDPDHNSQLLEYSLPFTEHSVAAVNIQPGGMTAVPEDRHHLILSPDQLQYHARRPSKTLIRIDTCDGPDMQCPL
jgi:hypothetical protein